ncbi:MAG TPA: hypothetical protein PLZ42_03025 [Methanothrix sp.]|nr:hypothetical protein [Methanothrix sp.]
MSPKSSPIGTRTDKVPLPLALLILLLSATLAWGALETNEYGEIVEVSETTGPDRLEDAAGTPAPSGGSGAEDGGALEAAGASDSIAEAGSSGMDASEKTDPEDAAGAGGSDEDGEDRGDSADVGGSDEGGEDGGEPATAVAVVYVINNDDDTLSISLFIDSELVATEEVSKDKEEKFGDYQLATGSHEFEITWWDDDTKKTHLEKLTATVEEQTAITLYATQNKEPLEHEIDVMLRNDNQEDLEAYLYIDGEYEKLKTAKKKSTTEFGKFDIEEGTHELAVRWQDPVTNVEYEKRKTIRVDGKDAVTFYAPVGMSFESDEETAAETRSSRTTGGDEGSSSTTAPASSSGREEADGALDTEEMDKEEMDKGIDPEGIDSDKIDPKKASSRGGEVGVAADGKEPTGEDAARSREQIDQRSSDGDGDESPDAGGAALYISTIGAILAIYVIFFRR